MPNRRSRSLKNLKIPLFFVFLCLAHPAPALPQTRQPAVVEEVLTGDSVRLAGGKTLRYAALRAPALQSAVPLVRTYGAESLAFNKDLVGGKKIFLEWGPQVRDDRGNLLAYVFLEDGAFVNDRVLKAGQAKLVLTPPNLAYAAELRQGELEARRAKKGLWRQEPENPFIKSDYIGEKNTKIFYFPTSPELDRIPEAQLVHFRSRVEATAAGYRACSTCKEGSLGEGLTEP
jgi:micrococcal nuclease